MNNFNRQLMLIRMMSGLSLVGDPLYDPRAKWKGKLGIRSTITRMERKRRDKKRKEAYRAKMRNKK